MNIRDIQPITSGTLTINIHLDVAATSDPLRVNRRCAGYVDHDFLKAFTDILNDGKVRAGNLDAHRRFNTRCQHIDARDDRHNPGIGYPREPNQSIELLLQLFGGHAFPPLIPRLELDEGLDHRQWRRIGSGIRPPHFAEHGFDFGDGGNQLVRLLQQFPCLTNGNARVGGGHVHQVAFIQWRDELTTDFGGWPKAHSQYQQRSNNRRSREA